VGILAPDNMAAALDAMLSTLTRNFVAEPISHYGTAPPGIAGPKVVEIWAGNR
jgi:hypothetical protein